MKEQSNNQPEQNAIRERICKHLREIEEQHHVKILYAVESGSRAWGFASPDSDWDVRFIYVHTPEWYFHIEEQKDTIVYTNLKVYHFLIKKCTTPNRLQRYA